MQIMNGSSMLDVIVAQHCTQLYAVSHSFLGFMGLPTEGLITQVCMLHVVDANLSFTGYIFVLESLKTLLCK